jgi:hypothetical protein
MSETFDHHDDDHLADGAHTPEHDEPLHEEPPAHDDALLHDHLPADEPDAAQPGADEVPAAAEAPGGEEWHSDPAADDALRSWLDHSAPALDPPPGFEQRLAEDLTSDAEHDAVSVDELVRRVLGRLGRS